MLWLGEEPDSIHVVTCMWPRRLRFRSVRVGANVVVWFQEVDERADGSVTNQRGMRSRRSLKASVLARMHTCAGAFTGGFVDNTAPRFTPAFRHAQGGPSVVADRVAPPASRCKSSSPIGKWWARIALRAS